MNTNVYIILENRIHFHVPLFFVLIAGLQSRLESDPITGIDYFFSTNDLNHFKTVFSIGNNLFICD